jgi:hypothetical protein
MRKKRLKYTAPRLESFCEMTTASATCNNGLTATGVCFSNGVRNVFCWPSSNEYIYACADGNIPTYNCHTGSGQTTGTMECCRTGTKAGNSGGGSCTMGTYASDACTAGSSPYQTCKSGTTVT